MKTPILPLALAAVLLGGCTKSTSVTEKAVTESPAADTRFDSLKIGMTTEEVEKILGKPTSKVDSLEGFTIFWDLESGEKIGITTDNNGKVTSTSRIPKK